MARAQRMPCPGQSNVAEGLDLATAVQAQFAAHEVVVACEQLPPACVAELGRALGRPDDVREHDGRQGAIGGWSDVLAGHEFHDL
jgi:hypothetical protein